MTLYTKSNSYPAPLPFRITLSDGTTRTDPTSFTAEEIADAGYTVAPDMPEDGMLWDTTTGDWRNKTPEELASETTARRDGMVVERWAFANAAMIAGYITADEAQAWGPGTALPATVEAAIAAAVTDPVQFSMAKVRALAAPRVSRSNPLIEILRGAFSLTPEQADDLFVTAQQIEAA